MPGEIDITILNVIGNLGAFSLLAYLAIYVMPKWLDDYRNERADERKNNREIHNNLLVTFTSEQRHERDMCQQQFAAVMNRLDTSLANLQKLMETHHTFAQMATERLGKQKE